MKKQFTILLILVFAFGLFPNFYSYAYYPDPVTDEAFYPKISSVLPTTVRIGNTLEISGENFDNAALAVGNRIGFAPYSTGEIISYSNTKILIRVDNRAQPGTSIVCLTYKDKNGGTIGDPCTPHFTVKAACDWSCNDWGDCSESNIQARTCVKPDDCQSLNTPMPQTTSICTYAPPCTSNNYNCINWGFCSNSKQTRQCARSPHCIGGVPEPATSQSCTSPAPIISTPQQTAPNNYQPTQPSCSADTWSCDSWNSCSLSGIQSRSCRKTFDCPSVQTPSPATDQYCEAPSRPTQQVPQDSSQISNQDTIIKATVKLICPLDDKTASQGSGTVIDSSGTILTNKHVVNGTLGCLVGFINDSGDEPYFGDRQIADISKISSSEDVAILKLRNPQNRTLSYIDITKSNSNIRLGTNINIYGYPAKFGTNMTYTNGTFSGTNGGYLKTTAIIEHGNSGGGAYLNDGTFIGIPSAVIKGELNALGYILSVNTINGWLGNSNISYNNNNNNNFSRVSSVLENIDLEKLGSLKLVILNEKGMSNTAPAVASPKAPTTIKPVLQQPSEIQKKETPKTESTPTVKNKETNGDKNSEIPTNTQPPKTYWYQKVWKFIWRF